MPAKPAKSVRMRSRNEQEKAERRELLLNAAQKVFFKKGFERTSMDDIATAAGFSRALLYVYFKDKKDIYRSLRMRSVETLKSRMLDHVDKTAPGIKQVRQVGEAFYNFYLHDKHHFDCLSLDITLDNQTSAAKLSTRQDPAAIELEKQTMEIMVNALSTGIEDGSIDPDRVPDLLQTAMYLRGSLHGVILLQDVDGSAFLRQAGLDRDALVNYALDNVTNSLGHGPS